MKTFTVIAIVIIAIVVVLFLGWTRVPDILANDISKKMRVPVKIDSIDLGIKSIRVQDFEIGNPPGTVLSKAFSAQTIGVFAPLTRYLDQQIVIDEMTIDNIYLDLEFNSVSSTDGNWTKIMANIQPSESATKQGENKKPPRSVLIKRIILTNINVDVIYVKEGGKVQHLPTIDRIELTNVSSEGGVPMDQIMNSVLGQMLKSVFIKQNLKNMLQGILNTPGNTIQKFISPFKGLFNANDAANESEEQSA